MNVNALNRVWGAQYGTCPNCGRTYLIRKDGAIRRHGTGKCMTQKQAPAELVPAILVIAKLRVDDGNE